MGTLSAPALKPVAEMLRELQSRNRPSCYVILNGTIDPVEGLVFIDETASEWAWILSEEKKARIARLMDASKQTDRYMVYCYEKSDNKYSYSGNFHNPSWNGGGYKTQIGPFVLEQEAINAALTWVLLW